MAEQTPAASHSVQADSDIAAGPDGAAFKLPSLPPEAVFWQYLRAIVVVTFDVSLGQRAETVYPTNVPLSSDELKTVAYLSLPDSNAGQNGDVQFSFRLRSSNLPLHASSPLQQTFLHGSVFFRQIRDQSLSRGYFQKSVVLISQHPFDRFLRNCSRVIGPLYFEFGTPVLDAVGANVSTWPPLRVGERLELPLAGTTIRFLVPRTEHGWVDAGARPPRLARSETGSSSPPPPPPPTVAGRAPSRKNLERSSSEPAPAMDGASATDDAEARGEATRDRDSSVPLFSTFGGLSASLWHLWELALTGEPILVLAPTPDSCSRAVLAIVSMVAPLRYCGDYRPYFTIHDPDFESISRCHDRLRGLRMPATILGVTNPYFLKALEFWPNVVSMGGPDSAAATASTAAAAAAAAAKRRGGGGGGGGGWSSATANGLQALSLGSASFGSKALGSGRYAPKIAKRSASLRSLITDQKYERSTVLTRDEPLMSPEKHVLKQLAVHAVPPTGHAKAAPRLQGEAGRTALSINNAVLRQHFQQLTRQFLAPLEWYFQLTSVGSTAKGAKRHGISLGPYDVPSFEKFSEERFLKMLERQPPPQLLRRIDWRRLYRRFLRGPHFWPWFNMRRRMLGEQLTTICRELRLHTDSINLIHFAAEQENAVRGVVAAEGAAAAATAATAAAAVDASAPPLSNGRNAVGLRPRAASLNLDPREPKAASAAATAATTSASASAAGTGGILSESQSIHLYMRVKKALNEELSKPAPERNMDLVRQMYDHLRTVRTMLKPHVQAALKRSEKRNPERASSSTELLPAT